METVKKYEIKDHNNFSSVVFHPECDSGQLPKTIGRVIPHDYGFNAVMMPGAPGGVCWPTKKEAVEAIIKNHKI